MAPSGERSGRRADPGIRATGLPRRQAMRRSVESLSSRFPVLLLLLIGTGAAAAEALPSWNDGPSKRAIVKFVTEVTTTGAPTFVPVADRLAVFDNDGTLWCEQPIYF